MTDPELPSCAPRELEDYLVENEQPDTNPLHDFDFQALEDRLNFLTLPVQSTDLNVCSGEVFMTLRLPIQPNRRVTPTCAIPTCHSVAQGEHGLSLAEGVAYGDLAGHVPENGTAFEAGKLRVDPGNPGNSFILDKLRGDLADGEGERMPFDLRRLRSIQIELIEEWIAAGAPETGFVAPFGCH